MIKSELIKAIADKMTQLPEHTVEEAVNLILARMSHAIANGQRIEIRGFGSFSVCMMPERTAHNPKTGEKVTTASKNKVHFKPGLELKQRLIKSQELVAIGEEA